MLKTSLAQARPMSLTQDTLVIGFDRTLEFDKDIADTPKNREVLVARLREITQRPFNVRIVFADDPNLPIGGPAPKPSPRAGEDPASFKDDAVIQKALEIFKGEVVKVKRPSAS
jgi:hypothetical protein